MESNPYAAPQNIAATPSVLARLYRPPGMLSNVLIGMLWILGLCDLLGAGLTVMELALVPDLAMGIELDEPAALGLVLGYLLVAVLMIPCAIGAIILFCIWISRANRNARALGAAAMQFTPGWCVGWFFIPIANLFKPYQAVKEVYRASEPGATPMGWQSVPVPAILGWWWGTWLVSNVLENASLRLGFREDPDLVQLSAAISLTAAALSAAAALFCIAVVRSINARQVAKAEQRPAASDGSEMLPSFSSLH